MVEVSTRSIEGKRFVCVVMHLPKLTTCLIYCTKGILFDECWSFETVESRCKVPVCIGKGKNIDELLKNPIHEISDKAKEKMIALEDTGLKAILKMYED